MGLATAEVIEEALRLSPRERAELAARLIESLDGDRDADAEAAWSDEIARRVHELDAGLVEPIPWSKAREMIRSGGRGSHEG
ncbi:MAG: addiction module protein [Armatimonadetes bacterium]|nr:addiction module protein [Armatimonadota bacterium]